MSQNTGTFGPLDSCRFRCQRGGTEGAKMTKSTTVQRLIVIATAAAVAGVAVIMMPGAPQALTVASVDRPTAPSHLKADRLPLLVTGAACSSHSWPNYD